MSFKIRLGSIINVACEEGDFPGELTKIDSESKTVVVSLIDPTTLQPYDPPEYLEDVPFGSLRRFDRPGPAETDDASPIPPDRRDMGFNQYLVKWTATNFKFATHDPVAEFYGQWRKTLMRPSNVPCYAVDMWAHYNGRDFAVESCHYTDDPRLDMRSLEGDLCAMANKFLFGRLSGNLDTLDDLIKRCKQPRLMIKNLQTLDTLLIRLKEIRDTAMSCGGTRYLTIPHDGPDDSSDEVPEVTLQINLTREALLLDGARVPSVDYGKSYLSSEGMRTHIQADKKTIRAIVEKLRSTQDPAEARRLRSVLRRMGHHGGSRFMPEED